MVTGAIIQWLAGWSGTWKEHDGKIGENYIWGRSMWIDLFKWVKKVRILLPHLNAC